MTDAKLRKLERASSGLPDTLSNSAYNAIMLGLVLYGFVVNALMVHLFAPVAYEIDYRVFLIGYFVCVIAGSVCAASTKPAMSFLGYNLIVVPIGVLLARTLPGYGSALVMQAILLTGAITLVMLVAASLCPHWFAGMGKTLFICLCIGLALSLLSWLTGFSSEFLVWGFAMLFTLYIGYDLQKARAYPKTFDNAIDSAIDLYLDIINLFLRILRILSKLRDD